MKFQLSRPDGQLGFCQGCGDDLPLYQVAPDRFRCRLCSLLELNGEPTHWTKRKPKPEPEESL